MIEITGLFETAEDARGAVRALHAAGFREEDIAFWLATPEEDVRPSAAEQSEQTGRRMGVFVADVGQSAVALMPFIGRNLANSPMGRALREATETGGAVAGRLFGALSEGGFGVSEGERTTEARSRAAVTVRTPAVREAEVVGLFTETHAIRVSTRGG